MAEPRILLFPYIAPGHLKAFSCLAELLSDAGFNVVFLNTEYNHNRIPNLKALSARFPTLHFATISDGLSLDRDRNLMDGELYYSMVNGTKSRFRELLQSMNNGSSAESQPPINLIITDLVLSSPIEVAEELGIPTIAFCPVSARYLAANFWIPKLIEEGQIPYTDDDPLKQIHGLPLSEGFWRRKDLPGHWSDKVIGTFDFSVAFVNRTIAACRTSALIINTFDELETPFLTYLSSIFNKIYTIGPIHALSKSKFGSDNYDSSFSSSFLGGFWKEDQTCMSWLDSQPSRSVIFVSFGTTVNIKEEELIEFWHGFVNSGKQFLWVLRTDVLSSGKNQREHLIKQFVCEKIKIVNWASQEQVLNHPAIAGFLTHCGWNSTMEFIVAGVPVICWPIIGDQSSNANWIHNVWKIGLELQEPCNRSTVETMVRALMEDQNGVLMRNSIQELSKVANQRFINGGASFQNLEKLIEDIKKILKSSPSGTGSALFAKKNADSC